jgi:putative transposase
MVSETTAMVLAEGHKHTMALDQSALLEVLDALKAADVDDKIRHAAETIYQALIEAELSSVIGALPHERTATRTGQRNGHRHRILSSSAGDLELRIPKLRAGSFFPSLLERRRRVDQSLFAVIMEAYLHGTSTRKVDDLVKALGADTGISKSEVSRICADLDNEVAVFRDRSLAEQGFPYVFLDATYCKARVNHRVVSQAVVVATGVAADGHREVLGFEVGDSEDGAFWTSFLRSLRARGLSGVQLVISDARAGLQAAIGSVLIGTSWQRCRVHFLRNVLAQVPKGSAEMVAAAIRTIFAQPGPGHVAEQPRHHRRDARPPAPQGRADAPRRRRRHHRLRRVPRAALEEDLVDEPARAAEQGNQAPHRRRRRVPQPRSPRPPRRISPGRSPRRMAGRR